MNREIHESYIVIWQNERGDIYSGKIITRSWEIIKIFILACGVN